MRNKIYYEKKAKKIIKEIKYLTLATTSKDGTPWNSPLAYSVDKDFNFYFGSPKNTQHSKNIRENNKGFVVVYDSRAPDGEGEGVYMTASVRELTNEKDIKHALSVMFGEDNPSIKVSDFTSKSKLRAYVIKPKKVWMNDAEEKEGLYFDYRVEVDLNKL